MCGSVLPVLVIVLSLIQVIIGENGVTSYTNLIQTRDNRSSNTTTKVFCILDYILSQKQTQQQKRNQFYDLENLFDLEINFCPEGSVGVVGAGNVATDWPNKFVLINYSTECDINEQINYFTNKSINGLFLSIGCSIDIETNINITKETILRNNFSVSVITESSVESIIHLNSNQLKLFNINFDQYFGYDFDYSLLLIWCLATFTVTLGAFWSGSVRLRIFQFNTEKTTQSAKRDSESKTSVSEVKSAEEEAFVNLSPFLVLGFVLLMTLMLLLLYYFYQYLVYVIIFLFTLASIASVFACVEPIILYYLPDCLTKPSFILFSVRCGKMYFYQLVLLVFAISAAVTWFVVRKESYAWIIQDLLGVCFSLNMLRTIRLPSYKICIILLWALFFYDIFFVFITPLITSKGNSVMVDVATGGSGSRSRCGKPGEQIPMVMKIPHSIFKTKSSTDPLDVCYTSRDYSLLGFGDILVPGLLISYCYAFDLILNIKFRVYYLSTCIGYGLGLIATFGGLYLMRGTPQPALLYLVPFTTISPILISIYRKEFRQLWVGPEEQSVKPSVNGSHKTSIEDDNLLIDGSQQAEPQTNS